MEEKRFDFGKNYVILDYKVKNIKQSSAASASFTVDPESYVVTLKLFNVDNIKINEATFALPLDMLIASAELDYENKQLIFNTADGGAVTCDITEIIDKLENAVYKDDDGLVPLNNLPKEYNTDFKIKAANEATEPNEAFNSKSLVLQNSVLTVFTPQPATYNISSPVLTSNMQTLFFAANGLTVFTIDVGTDILYQYSLGTAWSVDTINITPAATFAITSGVEGTANGMYIKPDGTQIFFVGSGNKKIYSLALVTPWSLTDATIITSSGTLPGLGSKALTSMSISDDGTTVYIGNSTDDAIAIFSLSIPWDVTSTITALGSISVGAQETTPTGIYIGDGGTKLFVVGSDSDKVHQYVLDTPWGTSATYSEKMVTTQQGTTTCVNFRPDGKRMFLVGTTTKQIDAYILDVAWDLTGGDPVEIPLNEKFYVNSTAEANNTNSKLKVSYQLNGGAITSLVSIDKEGRIETGNNILKTGLAKIENTGDRDLVIESNGAYISLGIDGDTRIDAGMGGIKLVAGTNVAVENIKFDAYTISSVDNPVNYLYLGDDFTEIAGSQVNIQGGSSEHGLSNIQLTDIIEFNNSYGFEMYFSDEGFTVFSNDGPTILISNVINAFKPIRNALYTTASRPIYPDLGYQIYDTTLKKPIWWNGTAWTDAMGNAV